jgi:uncharacterized protein YsxB (DUF464 family)
MKKVRKVLSVFFLIVIAIMMISPVIVFAADPSATDTGQGDVTGIIINTLLIPLLPTVSGFIVALIKVKMAEIKQNKYLNIAEDAVCTAVTAVSQTFVDALKKSQSFDNDAMRAAFNTARNKALTIMGTKAQDVIRYLYGDLDSWLENKIEYYVKISK